MTKTKIICIATMIAFAGAGQANASGLLGILSGNKTGVSTGSIVIAPSVDVGGVLSNNDKNNVTVLGQVLNGSLNGILSGNNTGVGIIGGLAGGKKKR